MLMVGPYKRENDVRDLEAEEGELDEFSQAPITVMACSVPEQLGMVCLLTIRLLNFHRGQPK